MLDFSTYCALRNLCRSKDGNPSSVLAVNLICGLRGRIIWTAVTIVLAAELWTWLKAKKLSTVLLELLLPCVWYVPRLRRFVPCGARWSCKGEIISSVYSLGSQILKTGLFTFTPFYVPCRMIHRGGRAARCRVKAAVRHTPCHKWCLWLFKAEKKEE